MIQVVIGIVIGIGLVVVWIAIPKRGLCFYCRRKTRRRCPDCGDYACLPCWQTWPCHDEWAELAEEAGC